MTDEFSTDMLTSTVMSELAKESVEYPFQPRTDFHNHDMKMESAAGC